MAAIKQLFKKACFGLSFFGETKGRAAALLKNLQQLNRFDQLLSLLQIFQLLATSAEVEILNSTSAANKAFEKQRTRMDIIYQYVEKHYNNNPDVNQVAEKVNLSPAAFCRYFKKQTQKTFTDFINHYRVNEAKNLLLQDRSVTEACFAAGFEQLSYFNRTFKKLTGENPSAFKKRMLV
jgi:AraC-like DNA-binding protein